MDEAPGGLEIASSTLGAPAFPSAAFAEEIRERVAAAVLSSVASLVGERCLYRFT